MVFKVELKGDLKRIFKSYVIDNRLSYKQSIVDILKNYFNTIYFDGKYTRILYNYLKYIDSKEITIDLDKLKRKLLISDSAFKTYSMFKIKVLNPAVKEINEESELYIEFKEIKENCRVISVRFTKSDFELDGDDYVTAVE